MSRPPFPITTPSSTKGSSIAFSYNEKRVDARNRHTLVMAVYPLRNLDRPLTCFNITRGRLQKVEWLLRNLVVQLMDVSDVVSADADDVSAGFRKGRHVGVGKSLDWLNAGCVRNS